MRAFCILLLLFIFLYMHWVVWLSNYPSGRLTGCQLEGRPFRQAFRLWYALKQSNKSPSITAMAEAMPPITSSSPPASLLFSFCPFNHSLSVRDVLISSFSLPPPSRVMSFDMRKCGPLTLETQPFCTEMSSLFLLLPDGHVSHTHLFITASVGPRAKAFSALCGYFASLWGNLHLCGVIYTIIFPYYIEGRRRKDYLLTL